MASHVDDRTGSVVHWFAPSGEKEGRVLLFHRKQRAVGYLGLACRGLGLDHLAVLPLRHEFERLEEEHAAGNGWVIAPPEQVRCSF